MISEGIVVFSSELTDAGFSVWTWDITCEAVTSVRALQIDTAAIFAGVSLSAAFVDISAIVATSRATNLSKIKERV